MKTFLLELREHAMLESNALSSVQVRTLADKIQGAIEALAKSPTANNLIVVNSLWARGQRFLDEGNTPSPPASSGAGLQEGARLAIAA